MLVPTCSVPPVRVTVVPAAEENPRVNWKVGLPASVPCSTAIESPVYRKLPKVSVPPGLSTIVTPIWVLETPDPVIACAPEPFTTNRRLLKFTPAVMSPPSTTTPPVPEVGVPRLPRTISESVVPVRVIMRLIPVLLVVPRRTSSAPPLIVRRPSSNMAPTTARPVSVG
jgi:hypothetical protein